MQRGAQDSPREEEAVAQISPKGGANSGTRLTKGGGSSVTKLT